MKFIFPSVIGLLVLTFGTSCVRVSTVVRVKKDGSGSIVSRYYFSPETLALVDQLGALEGVLDGVKGGPDLGMIRELSAPEEESLRNDAANFGEGVRYSKHEAGKDEEGWEGYSVVYDFDDIRKVRISQDSVPGKAKEFVESSGDGVELEKAGHLTFALEGDLLTVKSNIAAASLDGLIDDGQIKQAKDMGVPPSEAIKMAAGMTSGMRIGFFLRADGGIAETTAEHVTGDLIILSDADVAGLLNDPDLGEFIDQVAANPEGVTPESVKALFKKLEALTIESADEITVKLK